jgi:hypothetical protein
MIVRPENHTERPEAAAPFRVGNSPYILIEVMEARRKTGDSKFNASSDRTRAFDGRDGAAKGELP